MSALQDAFARVDMMRSDAASGCGPSMFTSAEKAILLLADECNRLRALSEAAPDLLAALKYARRNVNASECDIGFIDAAIAKATMQPEGAAPKLEASVWVPLCPRCERDEGECTPLGARGCEALAKPC
jgi:hypothetical protein